MSWMYRMIKVEMAGTWISPVRAQRNKLGFTAGLTSAACEWILIFLLLIDAVLLYLLTKFASYCKLQTPCILCSRLDHVLSNEKRGYYQNLLCSNHKSEITSLVSCCTHGKLADARGMCDDCLFSFTINVKPNPEAYRLLVGKLGAIIGGNGFQNSFQNKDLVTSSGDSMLCTCCGKPWRSGQNIQRLLQTKSFGSGVPKPNIPLPHSPGHIRCLNRRDSMKKIRDRLSESITPRCLAESKVDPLSHVGYTELKIASDSESEFPFSDDDDVEQKEDPVVKGVSVIPSKTLSGDSDLEKQIHNSSNARPPVLDSHVNPDVSTSDDLKSPASNIDFGNGWGEINWKQVTQMPDSSTLPQLISLDDVSRSSEIVEVSNGESTETKIKSSLTNNSTPALAELITLVDSPLHVGSLPEKEDTTEPDDSGKCFINKHEEEPMSNVIAATTQETQWLVDDSDHVNLKPEDLMNMSDEKKAKESSAFVAIKQIMEEASSNNENINMSLSHDSCPQGSNISSTIPSENGAGEEIQVLDAFTSSGTQVIPKSASVESCLESLDDGCSVSEIEGETIVDRLKRQLEHKKRRMNALYKELEEERNASEVAANQAMAMITKLQEEKAALQMEALQYLRMMEEQAEHDVGELEKANDLLAEKEKEIQDLEAELEFYRSNTDDPMVENADEESCNLMEEHDAVQSSSVPCFKNNLNVPDASCLEYKEEKLYLMQCLKNLERKLRQISHNETYSKNLDETENNHEQEYTNERTKLNGQVEVEDSHKEENSHSGSPSAQDESIASDHDECSVSKETNLMTSAGQKKSMKRGEVDLAALENEISDLNERLEALEADHDFLEHAINSLQDGNGDGLQFIQDIAHQLQELRNLGIKLRCRIRDFRI